MDGRIHRNVSTTFLTNCLSVFNHFVGLTLKDLKAKEIVWTAVRTLIKTAIIRSFATHLNPQQQKQKQPFADVLQNMC